MDRLPSTLSYSSLLSSSQRVGAHRKWCFILGEKLRSVPSNPWVTSLSSQPPQRCPPQPHAPATARSAVATSRKTLAFAHFHQDPGPVYISHPLAQALTLSFLPVPHPRALLPASTVGSAGTPSRARPSIDSGCGTLGSPHHR